MSTTGLPTPEPEAYVTRPQLAKLMGYEKVAT